MRCPEHPTEHVFKISVTQNDDGESSDLYCPYCGHHEDDLWTFASDQLEVMKAAAAAAAEQMMAAELGRICSELVAVYGLAIYCPNCGRMAPAQQFAELLRVQQERLAALDALPAEHKQALAESGVLAANYQSSVTDGFTALEAYLKARLAADAPGIDLKQHGAVFPRLDDASDLYQDHLGVDLPALVGPDGWADLLRAAALRHVLVHNNGIVDLKFLDRLPDWPQRVGQKVNVSERDARRFLDVLAEIAIGVHPA
jgi:hypothetical protein